MKDREQEASIRDFNNLIDNVNDKMINLEGELEEAKDLISKCKTLIADMVLYNMMHQSAELMKQAQELLTELKEY